MYADCWGAVMRPVPIGGPDSISFTSMLVLQRAGAELRLAGELDLSGVECLADRVEDLISVAPVLADVLLDVSGLTFVDVAGVRALLAACDCLRGSCWRLHVGEPQAPAVLRVLGLLGVDLAAASRADRPGAALRRVRRLAPVPLAGRAEGHRRA
jgi:anti-anti-sigma factor